MDEMTMVERNIRMVFDPVLKKPGCVLIQSAFGCGEANGIISRVDARLWLLTPTPDMRIFEMPLSEALKFPSQINGYFAAQKRAALSDVPASLERLETGR